jgi:hypothetical protein
VDGKQRWSAGASDGYETKTAQHEDGEIYPERRAAKKVHDVMLPGHV